MYKLFSSQHNVYQFYTSLSFYSSVFIIVLHVIVILHFTVPCFFCFTFFPVGCCSYHTKSGATCSPATTPVFFCSLGASTLVQYTKWSTKHTVRAPVLHKCPIRASCWSLLLSRRPPSTTIYVW